MTKKEREKLQGIANQCKQYALYLRRKDNLLGKTKGESYWQGVDYGMAKGLAEAVVLIEELLAGKEPKLYLKETMDKAREILETG